MSVNGRLIPVYRRGDTVVDYHVDDEDLEIEVYNAWTWVPLRDILEKVPKDHLDRIMKELYG